MPVPVSSPGSRGLKAARSSMARTSPVPSRASTSALVSCRMSIAELDLAWWREENAGTLGAIRHAAAALELPSRAACQPLESNHWACSGFHPPV
jgi:hypothetical protein